MNYIKAFEVLIAVADKGSFAAASRHLGISAPSITRIIADLEDDLGITLFHRTTRMLSLTDIGQEYLDDVRKIVLDLQTANDAAKGAYRSPTGHLRVTAPSLFGQYYVSPVMTEFLDLYEGVSIEALFLDRIVNLMSEGVDIAVRIGHLQDSNLMARKVGSVRSMICASPDYLAKNGIPSIPTDLNTHKLITTRFSDSVDRWKFRDNTNVHFTSRLTFTTVAASIDAAKSGWGITQALSYQVGPEVASGELKEILFDHSPPSVPIHVVHGEGGRTSAKVRAFVDLIARRLKKETVLTV